MRRKRGIPCVGSDGGRGRGHIVLLKVYGRIVGKGQSSVTWTRIHSEEHFDAVRGVELSNTGCGIVGHCIGQGTSQRYF